MWGSIGARGNPIQCIYNVPALEMWSLTTELWKGKRRQRDKREGEDQEEVNSILSQLEINRKVKSGNGSIFLQSLCWSGKIC
jgi:hypothetical protein